MDHFLQGLEGGPHYAPQPSGGGCAADADSEPAASDAEPDREPTIPLTPDMAADAQAGTRFVGDELVANRLARIALAQRPQVPAQPDDDVRGRMALLDPDQVAELGLPSDTRSIVAWRPDVDFEAFEVRTLDASQTLRVEQAHAAHVERCSSDSPERKPVRPAGDPAVQAPPARGVPARGAEPVDLQRTTLAR